MLRRSLVVAALACACVPRPPATVTPEPVAPVVVTLTTPPAVDPQPSPGVVEEPVAFTADPLIGPFKSVKAYCDRLARETREQSAEDGEGALQRCVKGEGARLSGPAPEGAAIRGARVLRIATAPFGAPLERCLIAVETAKGWYVGESDGDPTCSGVTGPSSAIRKHEDRLLRAGDGHVVAVESLVETELRSYDAGPDGNRQASFELARSRVVRLCDVGPSGVPSCTSEIVVGCPDIDGELVEIGWRVEGGTLRFDGAAASETCNWLAPPETAPLIFP